MQTVLIVEDEIFIALEIERILEDAGYAVIAIAADQAEALAAADRAQVAFVDVNLRDGPTGPALARLLGEKFGVKIVYVTANPTQIGQPAETAVGCIRKPFTERSILAAVGIAAGHTTGGSGFDEIIRV